jgi:MraZ protein
MLRGNYSARVDEKGRLKIPAAFLEELREQGTKFFVTSENGDFVRVYPMKAWNQIEEKLATMPSYNKAKQKFLTQTNYYGQVIEMDAQGRILLPPILREAAHTKGDVFVMGNLNQLQVWDNARFEEMRKRSEVTSEDLNELGI